jgi:CBS-domain-containing membrane protein
MSLDPNLIGAFSDWLINISAGLFGAAVFLPATEKSPRINSEWIIWTNLFAALVTFLIAYILKTRI